MRNENCKSNRMVVGLGARGRREGQTAGTMGGGEGRRRRKINVMQFSEGGRE